MVELNIRPYDEDQGTGLLRYVQVSTYSTIKKFPFVFYSWGICLTLLVIISNI